jgi:hypothetical protein
MACQEGMCSESSFTLVSRGLCQLFPRGTAAQTRELLAKFRDYWLSRATSTGVILPGHEQLQHDLAAELTHVLRVFRNMTSPPHAHAAP